MSHKWTHHERVRCSTQGDWAYCAHILVRQNIKGARRQMHFYYADDTADLWNEAIEFLAEGFSVISVDLWEVS